MQKATTRITTTKTNPAREPGLDGALVRITDLERQMAQKDAQIDGLQQGYLMVVDKMKELANEVVRLERHNGIGVNDIIIPRNWRQMPETKGK